MLAYPNQAASNIEMTASIERTGIGPNFALTTADDFFQIFSSSIRKDYRSY